MGENAVEVSAKWHQSEFDSKIEEIQKIDNVKNITIVYIAPKLTTWS
jgi:hypothetical protein